MPRVAFGPEACGDGDSLPRMESVKLDLTRHAVLESSAGTGKTYNIVQLVLRLLEEVEPKVRICQILVSTYTEKGAGELRERIRTALEEKLKAAPNQRGIWQKALDEFDQAPIFTIHGFCQRLLRDYPLEQNQDLRGELVDDGDLLEPLLRDIQRTQWPLEYGDKLLHVLEEAKYDRDNAATWEKRVREVARDFRPRRGHRVLPEPTEDIEGFLRASLLRLRNLAGFPGASVDNHVWISGFAKCGMHGNSRKPRTEKLLKPLLEWLGDALESGEPTRSYLDFDSGLRERIRDFKDDGFEYVYFKGEQREQIDRLCPGLKEAIEILEKLRRRYECIPHHLAVRTVHGLHDRLIQHKRDRGLYSFEDLIVQAESAIAPSPEPGEVRGNTLVEALRQRFRFAIVDEFQDTDPLQWRIFERLFLSGGQGRLFVVGDPKQAIFGFRGADLPTYNLATKKMREEYEAQDFPLKTNWRSVPEMLDALNRLFEHGEWFADSHSAGYTPVSAASSEKRRTQIIGPDVTRRAAVSLVDVQQYDIMRTCRREYAQFVAREIRQLIDTEQEITHDGTTGPMHYGHIAALVFRRSEAVPLVDALTAAEIPFTFYKQPGLWESDEAKHLLFVLKAISQPDDQQAWRKALLTRFFRLTPRELCMCEEIPASHPARQLMQKWIGLAEERKWSSLAHSLLTETGVLLQDVENPEFDRRLSNYQFLLARVVEWAYRDNLDLVDVLELFKVQQSGGKDRDDDVQPIETEQPKVKIMTVHASKGLEFPVVFLAGGFTKSNRREGCVRYRHESDCEVFDFSPDKAHKDLAEQAKSAEERRLLYVALTRAMLKLYVPLLGPKQGKGKCGSLCTILAPAVQQSQVCTLGGNIAAEVDPSAMPSAKPMRKSATVQVTKPEDARLPLAGPIFPQLPDDIASRRVMVHSFSSLHRGDGRRRQEQAQFGEAPARAGPEGGERNEGPLRGPLVGEMVHEILEHLDFAAVAASPNAAALLDDRTVRNAFDGPIRRHLPKFKGQESRDVLEKKCRDLAATLVWNALRTPLPGLDRPLCALPAADRISELEFQYKLDPAISVPEEIRASEGYVTGFIDLVFRKNGLVYLLDWKTNLLDSYDAAGVAEAMEANDYHLQYRLYLQALKRWLTPHRGGELDPTKSLGGVYYLFLRGMTGGSESPGIYFHRPTADDLLLEKVLR